MRLLPQLRTVEDDQADEARALREQVRAARVEFARRNDRWTEIAPAERLIPRGPARYGWLVDAETDLVWVRSKGSFFVTGPVTVVATHVDVTFYVDANGDFVAIERVSSIPNWSWHVAKQARSAAGAL
jgi:hypothetical protein